MNPFEFVDIHTHCLPGVDDGCRDIDETLAMLSLAHEWGTRRIVATPHMFTDLFGNRDFVAIRDHFDRLNEELDRYRDRLPFLKEMAVDLGAENHASPEFFEALAEGCVLSLNGGRYLLIEVPNLLPFSQVQAALNRVMEAGYVPVLAHTERIGAVQQDPDRVGGICRQGCVIQINGDSLLRASGSRSRDCADRLVKEGLVDVVASDGHGPRWRPPDLRGAFEKLMERYQEGEVRRWMVENPGLILANRELSPVVGESRA